MATLCASTVGSPKRRVKGARAAPVWGDGFVDDEASSLLRVVDWSQVSADEYAIPFPLLAKPGAFPIPLRSHLEDSVAVRRWRMSAFLGSAAAAPERVAALHRAWFADDDVMQCLLRKLGLLRTSPHAIERERACLALLERTLGEVSRGRVPLWDARLEAGFAFASGIHPAYLWAESGVSVERGYTAAWLGHLDRGRAALMPACVADYLLDAVVGPAGPRDDAMAELADGVMPRPALRRAAERRWKGFSSVVRPDRRPPGPALLGGAPHAKAAAEDVSLERA